jgi:hypothetical protein
MIRLNELHPETRLDLIEEAHWQHGREYVKECIDDNAYIAELYDWSRTRQGHKYWDWLDRGMPKE